MHAGAGDLLGGHAGGILDCLRIPAACHAELRREDRGARPERISVNAVIADEQRNTQTRLVAYYPRRTHEIVGRGVQNRPHMAVHNEIGELATARVELHHLPHLLLESHAAE